MNQQEYWRIMGTKFGYPKCCVDAFCKLEHINDSPRQLDGSGYIPCNWCNEHKTVEQLVNTINFNRDPQLEPFIYETVCHC